VSSDQRTDAYGSESAFARDLEDADVRDARSFSDPSQALPAFDGFADSVSPFGLGCVTTRRSAPHAGQGKHLEGVDLGLPTGSLGGVLVPLGSGEVLGAEKGEVALGLVDAAQVVGVFPVGLCGLAVSRHGGNLAYRGEVVK
jgi:hypothetical protein